MSTIDPHPNPAGHIADNVMHFARVLRTAGLPIGPDRVIDAVKAIEVAGMDRRDDFEIFDQAFQMFWRDPKMLERALSLMMPADIGHAPGSDDSPPNRLIEALFPAVQQGQAGEAADEPVPDASMSHSSRELLQHADFESMTNVELMQAKRLIARLRLPIPAIRTRRFRPDHSGGRADPRHTLRSALRNGGDLIQIKRRSPRYRHPPLVVLCDVSGSMSRYSRMFLHFLHAITSDRDRVTSFVFGTRLTNITRHLRHRDIDVAMNAVMAMVADWAGGTRIGQCLAEFNLRWSRRVLGQNATVLMISDGLDGDIGAGLAPEMERLHKSCRQLIWLNPLLRYEGFEARPAGIRAMLPHVDAFLPGHNINSLVDLAATLNAPPERTRPGLANYRSS